MAGACKLDQSPTDFKSQGGSVVAKFKKANR